MDQITQRAPLLFLAPMDGMTDASMRDVLTQVPGYHASFTEFLRVSDQVPKENLILRFLPELKKFDGKTRSGVPVYLQLLGGDPQKLAQTAKLASQLGVRGIDLNFGCPAPTVNRRDGGASILRTPTRVYDIISAVRAAVPSGVPISAKLRLGWDNTQTIFETAPLAAKAQASWITIHGRTKMQGYTRPAYWKPIGEVATQVFPTPVYGNGEIWCLQDYLDFKSQTGLSGVMLGRGAFYNPLLAREISMGKISTGRDLILDWFLKYREGLDRFYPELDGPKLDHLALSRSKKWASFIEMGQRTVNPVGNEVWREYKRQEKWSDAISFLTQHAK